MLSNLTTNQYYYNFLLYSFKHKLHYSLVCPDKTQEVSFSPA